MKIYQAEYYDKTGKIFHKTRIIANNLKEAWALAQCYKNNTPRIQQAGRVRTTVYFKELPI
jgi:hypothetical protein